MPNPVNLYETDNQYPSLNGTYLVACVMLAGIWNINPSGMTYCPAGSDPLTASTLQQIAWVTVLDHNKARDQQRAQRLEDTNFNNTPTYNPLPQDYPLALAQ